MAFQYPEPAKRRIGCKVKWYYYSTKKEALVAGKVAEAEAVHRADQGYDFGYQCPGMVRYQKDGPYAKLWEVCLP